MLNGAGGSTGRRRWPARRPAGTGCWSRWPPGPAGPRLVAGFASFGPATDPDRWPATDAELYELCVAQDQAGRGHGSRLLNAAAATMAEDGFGTACAWVLEQDAAARRFLESAGWAADGARRALDMGVPVPTLRLHAALEH